MRKSYISLYVLGVLFFITIHATVAQEFRTQSREYNEDADTLGDYDGNIKSRIISGKVRSESSNEALPIAVIRERGTNNAVGANLNGAFVIKLDLTNPVQLICSYIGFLNDTIVVNSQTRFVNFKLKETYNSVKEVVISASRKSERKFESPVTIEALTAKDILLNPSLTMYDRIVNMASVDVITTSMNFKTLNTRGFNSSKNHRFIQRFDDMDLSLPGFNLALGQLNGPIDIDVERMELIPGASSALYGPNAISGLMNVTSKNPFQYQGLSVDVKTGVNHVDGINNSPQPMYDFNMRYAKVLTKKFAAKVTFGYMKMSDWHATDYRDISNYDYTNNLTTYGYEKGPGNPGYNGVNIGGDEVSAVFDTSIKAPITNKPFLEKGALRVSRTGYREDQLFNYSPYNFKGDIGFYFRPKKGTELSWTSRFGLGSSSFLIDNRAQISNFFLQQHKLEYKTQNLIIRSYVSIEDIGEAIDMSLMSININRAAKPDGNWFMQYLMAYSGQYNLLAQVMGLDTLKSGDDAAARKFADGNNSHLWQFIYTATQDSAQANLIKGGSRFEPGTAAYDSVYNVIKSKPFKDNGGGLKSTAQTIYTEIIYDLSSQIGFASIQVGLNHRLYAPNTQGSIFSDAVTPIRLNEIGGFIQSSKFIYKDKLKLQASMRVDAFQQFEPRLSPRGALVYSLGKKKQHNLRVSAQIGYRMPALIDQFAYMDIPGALTFGGFYKDARNLKIVKPQAEGPDFVNVYTLSSVTQYLYTGDSNRLMKPIIRDLAPEELRTVEFGWRSFLLDKLESDVNVYFNVFQNLISAQQFIGPINREDNINAAYVKNQQKTQVYRRSVNSNFPISSYGFSLSHNYFLNNKWMFYANYNYNHLISSKDFASQDFVNGFNTPKHKTNIGFRGVNLYKHFGITSNLRWVDAFYFVEYDRVGIVDAYYNLDLMLNYTFAKQKTMVKIGGSNITNNRFIQALGTPTVGAIYYISVVYDGLIK
jgi:outer membrane receptor protein involved in Fe transport